MREELLAAFATAIGACDPARAVARSWQPDGRRVFALAVGKCALAMARGLGPVHLGLLVAPDDVQLAGWSCMQAAHPVPDERSVAAGAAAIALVEAAEPGDVVVCLLSGGASALLEQPRVPLAELVARVSAAMAAGAPIAELNALRTSLSTIKGGQLAARSRAPIVTLAVSDVVGDRIDVIGSNPMGTGTVILPMHAFADAFRAGLAGQGVVARRLDPPLTGDVEDVADRLVREGDAIVAYGEPTLVVPEEHGVGGRAQQLALLLARRIAGTARCAFVAGSDGRDGPTDAAGAFVDGTTWARVADGDRALARRDAGSALDRAGAVIRTGATGVNLGDVVYVGAS